MVRSENRFVNDLIAGCVSGITSVVFSHPIETIIVQKKINSPDVYRNMFHSFQLIYKHQGLIDGFYRGNVNLPIISPLFITSTQFCLYGRLRRSIVSNENDMKQYMLSGTLPLSLIATPIDLILVQMHGNLNRRHTHVFDFHLKDCFKYIYENNGGLKRIFIADLFNDQFNVLFWWL